MSHTAPKCHAQSRFNPGATTCAFAERNADHTDAVEAEHVVLHLAGAAVKDRAEDLKVLRSYWDVAVKPRANREVGAWKAYWNARKHLA